MTAPAFHPEYINCVPRLSGGVGEPRDYMGGEVGTLRVS